MKQTKELGTLSINQLLIKQSVPASLGILVMSLYMIVDTIFVGRLVGDLAIGAITVVMPITFLISALGMSIGIGGSSIISRALGADNQELANHTFGNQIVLTLLLSVIAVIGGMIYAEEILTLFGAKGEVMHYAKIYFNINLWGIPALAGAMMLNNVIRAVGFPKVAMVVMFIPAVANMILDPVLMIWADMGMAGAAWATISAYFMCVGYCIRFFVQKKSDLRISRKSLKIDFNISKEIVSLGAVTMARQGSVSLMSLILNNILVHHGGEIYLSVFGIISRVMMFALFPVYGITQGLLPIVGFNHGAGQMDRVKETLTKSIGYGTLLATLIFIGIMVFRVELASIFSNDTRLLELTPPAMVMVFLATALVPMQLMGAAYFQAIGKAIPALLLTLLRQVIFFIPLVYILPPIYGFQGVWYAFPVSDLLASLVTVAILVHTIQNTKKIKRSLSL